MERANTKHQPIFKIFTILDSGEYVEPGKHRADMNFQHFYIWHTLEPSPRSGPPQAIHLLKNNFNLLKFCQFL